MINTGTKLGRYEIRSKIGEGGMGQVYLVEDEQLRRQVALKVLPADLAASPDRMRRFVQEAQAAAALNPVYAWHYAVTRFGLWRCWCSAIECDDRLARRARGARIAR